MVRYVWPFVSVTGIVPVDVIGRKGTTPTLPEWYKWVLNYKTPCYPFT